MKKFQISIMILVLMSLIAIDPINAMGESSWGVWQESPCYKGIEFRIRETTNQYTDKRYDTYLIQIKNNYEETVHVNWEIVDKSDAKAHTTNRATIKQGMATESLFQIVHRDADISIMIDKLRFGKDGLQPYVDCDKQR